jgi:hypothetical protein
VPGFHRQGGGFLIPNSVQQSWLETDPKKHVEIMTAANKAHGGDLVPLVKMIKGWNRTNNKYFNSFHLETITLQILNNIKITDFSSGARFVFDKARTIVTQKNLDPAGYGGDVGAYINTQEKIREAAGKFQIAYDRALKAEASAQQGRVRESIETWGKIFGDYFPAYG